MCACIESCRTTRPHREASWCPPCVREDAAKWDEMAEVHELHAACERSRAYIPATDGEWRRRLDDLAPVVMAEREAVNA